MDSHQVLGGRQERRSEVAVGEVGEVVDVRGLLVVALAEGVAYRIGPGLQNGQDVGVHDGVAVRLPHVAVLDLKVGQKNAGVEVVIRALRVEVELLVCQ